MSVLAVIVGHPSHRSSHSGTTGFQRLKPAVDAQPQFLSSLVEKIASADHALCANSLQLINALMRDAIANDAAFEWPKFIKQLQELGVIKSVYGLMQSTAIQDLAHPLLDFQTLTKTLLRNWREEKVDMENPDHRRAIRGLHTASQPDKPSDPKGSKKHHPEKWSRLGFETESPVWEFNGTGFLGLMDITDFVYKNEDGFQKLLLEQSAEPAEQRCPIARASLSVTQTHLSLAYPTACTPPCSGPNHHSFPHTYPPPPCTSILLACLRNPPCLQATACRSPPQAPAMSSTRDASVQGLPAITTTTTTPKHLQ